MIGIGISTYNRSELVSSLVQKIRETIDIDKCKFVVSDDGSSDNTIQTLQELKVPFLSGQNKGSTANKNRLIRHLADCDYIFIIEDDVIIYKEGWDLLYIDAHKKSGIHHFVYCPSWYYGESLTKDEYDGITITHPPHDGGTFSFYTREVIETCGGFHTDFRGYGWGHCEFTERIHRAGLSGKYKINHVLQSEEFLTFRNDIPRANPKKDEEKERINMELWRKCREQQLIKVDISKLDVEEIQE